MLTRSRPSTLPCGRWPFSRNALRSDGAFLEPWHRNCPSMERSGKDPMLSMTGVGAYPAQEPRMHSVNHRLLYVFVLHMVWTSCLGGWTSLALAQVSTSPHVLWQPPDLHGYTRALQQPEGSPLAPEKRY